MLPEGTFEIGGGEIFWSGIGPVANWCQPLISDLGIGGAYLVVRGEIIKVDVDLDAALFHVRSRGQANGRDDEGLAVPASFFCLLNLGDLDLSFELGRRGNG